jgi:sugar transferase (PEP-CTERM/EpsH1 system associated)
MTRTIRILHVLHAFSAGGLENGLVNIINRSPSHLEHELCLLSTSGEFAKRLTRPVVLHEMNKKSGNDLKLILRLRELFRKRDIDIVHTRNWAAFDGVLAACLTSGPALVHGEHGRDISDPQGEVSRRNFARRLLAFRANKYVAVSKDLYTWLKDRVRIPATKLALIRNGVDTERFCPGQDPELKAALGIGQDEFVIGTIGRLDPIKNHQGLINAVHMLTQRGYPVRLVIVGDGPLRANLESSLRKLAPQTLLLGYRPDVERFYRVFDIFVLNSFAEGMSNTLLEAMASGMPTVSTDVGGNRELVVNRQAGILIAPDDDFALANALQGCIDSPGILRAYGINARRFTSENFSLRGMIEQYTTLYEAMA